MGKFSGFNWTVFELSPRTPERGEVSQQRILAKFRDFLGIFREKQHPNGNFEKLPLLLLFKADSISRAGFS